MNGPVLSLGCLASPVDVNDMPVVHIPLLHGLISFPSADAEGQDIHLWAREGNGVSLAWAQLNR